MKLSRKVVLYTVIAALIVISVATHWSWVASLGTFTALDWRYAYPESMNDFLQLPQILWQQEDFTVGAPTPTFYPLRLIGGLLTLIGLGYSTWERLLFLWPIVFVGPLPIFFYVRSIVKNPFFAGVGALLYALNSYILVEETSHLYIVIGYFIAPLVLLFFDRFLRAPTHKNMVLFGGTVMLMGIYEMRILYLLCVVMLGKALYDIASKQVRITRGLIGKLLLVAVALGALQAYWLLAFIFERDSLGYSYFAFRNLFTNFFSLLHGVALTHPFWSPSSFVPFATHPISFYAWIFPSMVVFALFSSGQMRKKVWFWVGVSLVGIFLVKQSAAPFPHVYQWLYAHIPGFNLFRESSKFFLYVALAYSVLVPLGLQVIYSNLQTRWRVRFAGSKRGAHAAALTVITLCIVVVLFPLAQNIYPLLSRTTGGIWQETTAPASYLALKDIIKRGQAGMRTLWVPTGNPYGFQSNEYPSVHANRVSWSQWKSMQANTANGPSFLDQQYTKALLNFGSINTVIVPSDSLGEIYTQGSIGPKESYERLVDAIPGLDQIVDTALEDVSVWHNRAAKDPYYFSTNTIFVDESVRDFAGNDKSKTNAYIFSQDLSEEKRDFAERIADNKEFTVYAPDRIRVEGGQIIPDLPADYSAYNRFAVEGMPGMYRVSVTVKDSIRELQFDPLYGNAVRLPAILIPDEADAVHIDETVFSIPDEEDVLGYTSLNIGESKPYTFVADEEASVMENKSFDRGLWSPVRDCNNYDNTSNADNGIAAEIVSGTDDRQTVLALSARSHIACEHTDIRNIGKEAVYTLSFDYKAPSRKQPYTVIFNNSSDDKIIRNVLPTTHEWSSFSTTFVSKSDLLSLGLVLYQPGDEDEHAMQTSFFDNVVVRAYRPVKRGLLKSPKIESLVFERVPSDSIEDMVLEVPMIDGAELIRNGSFEEPGSWKIGDCNNINGTSLEDNGIALSYTPGGTDGVQAALLEAKRHTACISTPIDDFSPSFDYLVSFDYKHISGPPAQISLAPYASNPTKRPIEIAEQPSSEWRRENIIIKADDFRSNMRLYLYVPTTPYESSKAMFDNVHVFKIPRLPVEYMQTTKFSRRGAAITSVATHPTRRVLAVSNLTQAQLLVFSDYVNPNWRVFIRPISMDPFLFGRFLYAKPGWQIPVDNHLQVNGFTNGWWIDPGQIPHAMQSNSGDYIIEIEYWPQRTMNIGAGISGATILGLVMWWLLARVKARRTQVSQKETPDVSR